MQSNWELIDVFAAVKKIPNARILQDAIYLAQTKGVLSHKYDFVPASGSFASPFSSDLDHDLTDLEFRSLIEDTRTGNSYVLTDKARNVTTQLQSSSQGLLKKLLGENPDTLDALASVAYVRDLFKSRTSEEELAKKIADYFAVEAKSVQKYIEQLKELEV